MKIGAASMILCLILCAGCCWLQGSVTGRVQPSQVRGRDGDVPLFASPLSEAAQDALDEIDERIHWALVEIAWCRGLQRIMGDAPGVTLPASAFGLEASCDDLVGLQSRRRQMLRSYSLPADRCEIHGDPLIPVEVPIRYGYLGVSPDERDRKRYFRNGWCFVRGGCVVGDELASAVEVPVCSSCRAVARRWRRHPSGP